LQFPVVLQGCRRPPFWLDDLDLLGSAAALSTFSRDQWFRSRITQKSAIKESQFTKNAFGIDNDRAEIARLALVESQDGSV